MTGRHFLFCAALLLLVNTALGDGIYQRTRNGKTLVWNDHPQSGDQAIWSGARDRDGYARGFGTLSWYTTDPASAKLSLYARYFGNMTRGRFSGPVNVHAQRKTRHALFADGARVTRWSAGPASSRSPVTAEIVTVVPPRGPSMIENANPEPPAAGPLAPRRELPNLRAPVAEPRTDQVAEPVSSGSGPKIDIDYSLVVLAWPPQSLRMRPAGYGPPSPQARARLTNEEVVDLADAIARSRSCDPTDYDRPEPHYDPVDQTWSIEYNPKAVVGPTQNGERFSVAVNDKTKAAALVQGRKRK